MAYEIQYRLLTDTEKELFYKDFINFLAVHGIPGEEWERIKKEDKHQMMLMFAQFSDLVIHKSLSNIKFAYKIEEDSVIFTCFNDTSFEICSIAHHGNLEADTLQNFVNTHSETVEILSLPYPEKGREKYIYQLTGLDGYSPCGDTLWLALQSK